ncbi:MAG: exosome complex protein Rrp42 [Asgard group archaeon]|nr:exosome complex protein Rrp42 [Asgard group archaeon]
MGNKGLISVIEKEHIKSLLDHGKRNDGRKFDEYRSISIIPNYIQKAEGSAIAKLGRTKVIAGVKTQLGTPFPDSPDKGVVTATVEMIPLASPDFESGPPRERAIELARVTDRAIRESNAVSQEELVIIPGKLVRILFIDIYVLDYDGNLFDACNLAAVAALLNTKLPEVKVIDEETGEHEILETTKPLKMDHIPISATFSKIGDNHILDPSLKEEGIQDARITIALTEDDQVCSTQKGESGSYSVDEIKKILDIASERTKEIRSKLEKLMDSNANPWSEDK